MISIVSYNIRTQAPIDGINNFPNRVPLINETLHAKSPDIIGFQEMKPQMLDAVRAMLPDYTFAGTGRGARLDDESNNIAVKTERFTVCATDTYWLSPTPDIPGSRYEKQSSCPRILTWVRLYDKADGRYIWVINTHLDHQFTEARDAGLKQVLECARGLKRRIDAPLFITGDFNFTPADPEYALLRGCGFTDLTDVLQGTYHGYGTVQNCRIDYILTDQPRERFEVGQWHICRDGVYLSDHDPVFALWDEA